MKYRDEEFEMAVQGVTPVLNVSRIVGKNRTV